MTSFKSIFKVTDGSGNCIQYAEGDIVYKNGEAYKIFMEVDKCRMDSLLCGENAKYYLEKTDQE
jgi:hypothetical protein